MIARVEQYCLNMRTENNVKEITRLKNQEAEFCKMQPIIVCMCGAEFLLLPDLAEMSKVITEHAQAHREKAETKRAGEAVFLNVEDHLTAQVLEKASKAR